MNTLPDSQPGGPEPLPAATRPLLIFGVGDAGCAVIERLGPIAGDGVERLAVNTDMVALNRVQGIKCHALGRKITRGLSCGGDPVQGANAAESDLGVLSTLVEDVRMVWIVAGLGGGTGGGAAPVLARAAREKGALVLAFVILPFEFEGIHRREQAEQSLGTLRSDADAVICLPNQGMARLFEEKPLFNEVYAAANELIAAGVMGVWKTLQRPGMVPLGFGDFERLLRGRNASSTLAMVETSGENRTRDALDRIQNHPFLQAGLGFADADSVLISVAGGTDIRFDEVEWLHGQFQRLCDHARVVPGTALDESLTGRVHVTALLVRSGTRPASVGSEGRLASMAHAQNAPSATVDSGGADLQFEKMDPHGSHSLASPSPFIPEAPSLTAEQMRRAVERQIKNPSKRKRAVQTLFNFDVVSLGRFAQTEPTMRDGENLDEPTWARRGITLN
jgi:cell division protein FtsZ